MQKDNVVDLTEILIKSLAVSDAKKPEMLAILNSHLDKRRQLQEKQKILSQEMMAYDKGFLSWLNSWVVDDKASEN